MKITIGGSTKEYPEGTTYMDLAREYQGQYASDIVLVQTDGKLRELFKRVKEDCKVEFVTTADTAGVNAYRRSAAMLMMKAAYRVAGERAIDRLKVEYSLSNGYYCTLKGEVQVDEAFLSQVKDVMLQLVKEEIPFQKRSVHTDEAIAIFHAHGMYDKEKLFRYRRASRVNLYSLRSFEDYHYGYMVAHTGYLKYFDLHLYDDGFVLQFPSPASPREVPPFKPQHKLFQVLKESTGWGDMLGISTVGDLNDCISHGGMEELILTQEALQEQKIADIARQIKERKNCKFVMIAGPSSSGKTTFSHRLSVQLKAQGLRPHPVAVDNYFVERELTPKDEKGDYNFECLGAIDIELFNRQMTELLEGKRVEIPSFNFKAGKKEYNGDYLKLGEEDILVLEGIHCLNDALSHMLPRESKFKIYISALTQLNVDEHNRIPTTDGRLLRRMVRDARTRGTTAARTIQMWPSVRRGEEENIFPYQEEADAMFNSALIYELAVLKQYAEPALFGIDRDAPEYTEAKRLLKFLDYFVGVDSAKIPNNSILREFIGGGCFRV
ncbi:MAG: nucleoside kinase [Lachnospiraceae bacterium]|jgi:uridine kinase|nr:nucleoside kinase [Lachnospiraceae bacterium]